jgi:protein SCO1/2
LASIAAFLCLLPAAGCRQAPDLPVYGEIPDFSLIDSSGRTFARSELAGKVWVADFIFTNCAGACPSMTEKMRKFQDAAPPEVQLVSFTVDPARDTPEVLAAYAKNYGADSGRWHFLTGGKDALYKLSIEGFKLAVDDTMGSEIEPITHSSRFVLVDRQGRIRGFYSGSEEQDLQRLVADARTLL